MESGKKLRENVWLMWETPWLKGCTWKEKAEKGVSGSEDLSGGGTNIPNACPPPPPNHVRNAGQFDVDIAVSLTSPNQICLLLSLLRPPSSHTARAHD